MCCTDSPCSQTSLQAEASRRATSQSVPLAAASDAELLDSVLKMPVSCHDDDKMGLRLEKAEFLLLMLHSYKMTFCHEENVPL